MDLFLIFNSLNVVEIISYILVGILFSSLIAISGVGAGAILVPFLILVFNLEVLVAVGTASFYSFGTKVFSTYSHMKLKNIDYKIYFYFILGAIPTIVLTIFLIDYFKSLGFQKIIETISNIAIILVLITSVILVLQKIKDKKTNVINKKIICFFGGVIGIVMSFTGIGGGVSIIPLLKKATNLKMKKIVGTSILIAGTLSLLVGLLYSKTNTINYPILIFMFLGAILSIPLNMYLIKTISEKLINRIVITSIIISSILLSLRTFNLI